jgi:hypothetical protein
MNLRERIRAIGADNEASGVIAELVSRLEAAEAGRRVLRQLLPVRLEGLSPRDHDAVCKGAEATELEQPWEAL